MRSPREKRGIMSTYVDIIPWPPAAMVWLCRDAYFRAVEGSPALAARKTRYNVHLRGHYTIIRNDMAGGYWNFVLRMAMIRNVRANKRAPMSRIAGTQRTIAHRLTMRDMTGIAAEAAALTRLLTRDR